MTDGHAEWVAPSGLSASAARDWLADRADALGKELTGTGTVIIRGLPLRTPADLGMLRPALGTVVLEPTEWLTRRDHYGNGVYSAVRWAKNRKLCLSNEMAYSHRPPRRIAVACLRPADVGGEMIVGDGRRLLTALPPSLVHRAQRAGWLLVRHFRRYIGSSWQVAFGTAAAADVEAYCARYGIDWEWLPDDGLRTTRRRPAVIRHPDTGEECWFNQLAFLNRWALEPAERSVLQAAYGIDALPVDTYLADGVALTEAEYDAVADAYADTERKVAWRPGDLLLLDNLMVAHGRLPYEGHCEMAVMMLDPVEPHDAGQPA